MKTLQPHTAWLLTSQNVYTQVDIEDLPLLLDYVWHAIPQNKNRTQWRIRGYLRGGNTRRRVYLHQLLIGCKFVDHIDRDPLNNTRANLRLSSPTGNQRNKTATSNTGHIGVSWDSTKNCYVAHLSVGPRHNCKHYTKTFKSLPAAVEYRKQLEREHWK